MTCYHPRPQAVCTETGRWLKGRELQQLSYVVRDVSCGQCLGCRLAWIDEWKLRATHEAMFHESSCMVTLTYAPENFPASQAQAERDVVLFVKRLRQHFKHVVIKTSGVFELGEKSDRPHFHIICFGLRPNRSKLKERGYGGGAIWICDKLTELWGKGHVTWIDFAPAVAGYVFGYGMKKYSRTQSAGKYVYVRNSVTGKLIPFEPVKGVCKSLKPGIGYQACVKYGRDWLRLGGCSTRDGKLLPIPDYYLKVLRRLGLELEVEDYLHRVAQLAMTPESMANRTPERLQVREVVRKAGRALAPSARDVDDVVESDWL